MADRPARILAADLLHVQPDREFWEKDLLLSGFKNRLSLLDDADGLLAQIQLSLKSKPSVKLLATLLGIGADGLTIAEIQQKLVGHPLPCLHFIVHPSLTPQHSHPRVGYDLEG